MQDDRIRDDAKPCARDDAQGQRIFLDNLKWTDMEGRHPLAVPGRSPFVYGSDSKNHALEIKSLDLDFSEKKPEDIQFNESALEDVPQIPFYQTLRLVGFLDRSLEHWPFFCIQQSLAEGEPAGFPGFTSLKPWEDKRIGWIRIFQNGRQMMETDVLVAGLVEFHCCCVGMLDDPSQGGLKGRNVFKFDAYLEASRQSTSLTSLRAEFWTKSPNAEWP